MSVRHHRWLPWAISGVAAVFALSVAAAYLFVHFLGGSVPAPLSLSTPGARQVGYTSAMDGTWISGKGSVAGYRISEEFLGRGGALVGRTDAVTGTLVITPAGVTSASFTVDLRTLESNGKLQPQLAEILDTGVHPAATFTLTTPIARGANAASGSGVTMHAAGMLTMHGASRPVTLTMTAGYDGSALEAAGSFPISFPNWNIETPMGLDDHATVEFLVVLHR